MKPMVWGVHWLCFGGLPEITLGDGWSPRDKSRCTTVRMRIDIDTDVIKIILRVNQKTRGSGSDAIAITLPRPFHE